MDENDIATNDNIELDEFVAAYNDYIKQDIHGALLTKCMDDYNGVVDNDSICFKLDSDNSKIKDKDDNEVSLSRLGGGSISYTDLFSAYGTGDISYGEIVTKRDIVSNAVNIDFYNDYLDFRTSLGDVHHNATGITDLSSNKLDDYITQMETTKADYKEMRKKRNALDNKMREIYGERGDVDLNLDSSVYSTMLFTILTTSLLYYLFRKM